MEAERDILARAREEALDFANQRQTEMEDLRRVRGDWERYKERSDIEQRVSTERITQLLLCIDELQAELRPARQELARLRQLNDEKHAQHRGLRSEHDLLHAAFERHKDQSKRQVERLLKEKEALHEQLQSLRREALAESAKAGVLPEQALVQLAAELSQAHSALVRENEALGSALTAALRSHLTASQANPLDPAGLRVRDALERARSHAEQIHNWLEPLARVGAPLRVQTEQLAQRDSDCAVR